MAGVEVRRGFLPSLRHHPCGIRPSRHAPWSEQFALQIVLGFPGLSIVDLPANFHAFVKYLSAGLQSLVRDFIAKACHWLILWLLVGASLRARRLHAGHSSSCIVLMRRAKTLICFRNFREIVSAHEFDSIGEEMKKQEVQKFGEDGSASVAEVEQTIGIADLNSSPQG